MKLILTRHAETIEYVNGIVCGQLPGTLSKLGKKQASLLAQRLKDIKIDYIYSSDLARAVDTTKEVLKFHTESTVFYVPELREKNQWVFEGRKDAEVSTESWRNKVKKDSLNAAPKNGESKMQVYKRVEKFLKKILKKHKSETILIVAHGGVLRSLFCLITNKPPEEMPKLKRFLNTSVTVVEIKEYQTPKIHIINCVEHTV